MGIALTGTFVDTHGQRRSGKLPGGGELLGVRLCCLQTKSARQTEGNWWDGWVGADGRPTNPWPPSGRRNLVV